MILSFGGRKGGGGLERVFGTYFFSFTYVTPHSLNDSVLGNWFVELRITHGGAKWYASTLTFDSLVHIFLERGFHLNPILGLWPHVTWTRYLRKILILTLIQEPDIWLSILEADKIIWGMKTIAWQIRLILGGWKKLNTKLVHSFNY